MKKTILIILLIVVVTIGGCATIIYMHNQKYPRNQISSSNQATQTTEAVATEETNEAEQQDDNSNTVQSKEATPTDSAITANSDGSEEGPDIHSYDNPGSDALIGDNIIQGTATEANTSNATTEFPDCFDLELELISQYPELPAGCESVSLTMILNYYGYNLNKTDIVDDYLVYSGNFVMGYCGNPYSYDVGGGIYAPGMTITANNFLEAKGSKHYAENITGTDFDTLLEYVAQGHPILIWSTISMMSCSKGAYNYDDEGNPYAWDYNEHCVVLAGYDYHANSVTIYDPIDGLLYRKMDEFEAIYNDMEQMAIIIKEN